MATDKVLFYLCVFLIGVGIVFSLSLSVFTVRYYGVSQFHFFELQFFVGVLSIFIMWGLSRLNPDKAMPIIGFILCLACSLLICLMPWFPPAWVTEAGGARRWIRFPGFSLAPVEFFKIGFVYFLAWSFNRKLDHSNKGLLDEVVIISRYLFLFIVVACVIAGTQNDLGQVVVLALILIVMACLAGMSFKLFSIGVLVAALVVYEIIINSSKKIERIQIWWVGVQDMVLEFFPDDIASTLRVENIGKNLQISNSLNAIKHGDLFGQGLGQGSFKLGFLSDVHTDFVLSGISEEIGFVGLGFISFMLFAVIFRIFQMAKRSENRLYYLFASGVGLLISFSFLMNALGITAVIPAKGIAVPFLSYGGSSLLALSMGVGMVLMISKRRQKC